MSTLSVFGEVSPVELPTCHSRFLEGRWLYTSERWNLLRCFCNVVKHHVRLGKRLGRNKDEEDIRCAGNIEWLNPGMFLRVSVLGLDLYLYFWIQLISVLNWKKKVHITILSVMMRIALESLSFYKIILTCPLAKQAINCYWKNPSNLRMKVQMWFKQVTLIHIYLVAWNTPNTFQTIVICLYVQVFLLIYLQKYQ